MKFIFSLVFLASMVGANAQTITANGTTAANALTTGQVWSFSTTPGPFPATTQVNGNQFARRLNITGFDFSSLPSNATITGFSITVGRYASQANRVGDVGVFLVVNGTANPTSIAPGVPSGDWPTASTSTVVYTASNAGFNLTPADLNANFGVQILANRLGGSGGGTDMTVTGATITVSYNLLAPIILTRFDVTKNADNHVNISWSTSTEENVKNMYVERSSDGRNFSPIFTVTPVGARNKYTKYVVTDKTPVEGSNYYRLKEVDFDGNVFLFDVKGITINKVGQRFQAFNSGSEIKVNVSGLKGNFAIAMHDAAGALVSSRNVTITGNSFQSSLTSPRRTGVYTVTLRGENLNETARIFVEK